MRIAHVSDTHINKTKYHNEYRNVFEQLYTNLKNDKVDLIVHTGDIFHSKLDLTPECVELATEFLSNLADIAPLHLIAGNHDANLKNSSRLDSISPIERLLVMEANKNIKYYRSSSTYDANDKIVFKVFSQFDQANWHNIRTNAVENSKIIIGLYHGCINGSKTDEGFSLKGEFDTNLFFDCDYVFLGDIHKTNQIMDSKGKWRYPGSTIQQNFGETNDKGYLLWDIRGKDDFSCKHIALNNPSPFVTVYLDENGDLPKYFKIVSKSKVRVIANSSVSIEKIKKAIQVIKNTYDPVSVTFVNKSSVSTGESYEISTNKENIRNLKVQEKYIREFLKDYKPSEKTIQDILSLNEKLSKEVLESEETQRYVNWKIKTLEWDNLFNYGENNSINFDNLKGLIGIFGPNYSGKSSLIDSLLYTAFNTTSKNNRKNLNVINQNKNVGRGKLVFSVDNIEYQIERDSSKYTKKLKGITTTEAKTDVKFNTNSDLLNGVDRSDTDKLIRKYIGNIDDFLLTSMASQFGSLSFISEGSTKRKEILSKFLDLDTFEKKFKLAKEECADLKVLIKKSENINFDADINSANETLNTKRSEMSEKQKKVESLKKEIEESQSKISGYEFELKKFSNVDTSISNAQALLELQKYSKLLLVEEQKVTSNSTRIKELETNISDISKQLSEINIDFINQEKEQLEKKVADLEKLNQAILKRESEIQSLNKKISLLDEVPCGTQYSHCKFIKDAFSSKDLLGQHESELVQLNNKKSSLKSDIPEDKVSLNKKLFKNYSDLETTKASLEKKLLDAHKSFRAIEEGSRRCLEQKNKYQAIVDQYDRQQELIKILNLKEEESGVLATLKKNLLRFETEINKDFAIIGSTIERLKRTKEIKQEFENTLSNYNVYDLYMKSMHPNGVPYDIIKKNLPIINSEIQRILTGVVDFEIYLENDDDKLDIMIKHNRFDPRPLEMGSGAEKSLAAIAIRLALVNITSLPKPDIFILDEPATSLDEGNMDGFIKILDLIKTQFKTVFLISHLEALKDCVDTQIIIDKKEGFAHINI